MCCVSTLGNCREALRARALPLLAVLSQVMRQYMNLLTTGLVCAAVEGRGGSQHVLVAGARDALLSVWPLTPPSSKSRAATPLPRSPSHYLYGHDAPITALATSSVLRTAVSAAANGTLLLHHVPTGRLLRSFPRLPRPASLVAISDVTPAVVTYCPALRRLHCFHIQVWDCTCMTCIHILGNGALLAVGSVEEVSAMHDAEGLV